MRTDPVFGEGKEPERATAIHDPLERWGFKFKYLFNAPDSPMDVQGIIKFGRAAQVARRLRKSRMGMIGFNDMGLFTTDFSMVKLCDRIGLEVIERVIRMYLATVEICKEKNFSGFSYKSVDGVDAEMGLTHAVPSALVAAAGYPYVDENDIRKLSRSRTSRPCSWAGSPTAPVSSWGA